MHPDPVRETTPEIERPPLLLRRQEAFCRHFVATGNVAASGRSIQATQLERRKDES